MLLSVVLTDRPSKWIHSNGAGLFKFCGALVGVCDGLDIDGRGMVGFTMPPFIEALPGGGERGAVR